MNTFKKVLYNITRPYAKKYITGHLGKVVEEDNKIICYVKKSKVKNEDYNYIISCLGIGDEQKGLTQAYKLDKPICYVIDGIELKKHKVYILGYDGCEVIIKNCNFGLGVHVMVNGKCTLDNTNITTFSYLSIYANELTVKNMDSEQIRVISKKTDICFGANNRIDVIDSIIGSKKKDINVSFLVTNELNVVNSKIVGKGVECESKVINVDEKSSLIATNNVNLKTDDFNPLNITSPTIILNEELIENENGSVLLKKITEPLEVKRCELVNLLKRIKTECENINSEKLVKCQELLNSKSITKILKR